VNDVKNPSIIIIIACNKLLLFRQNISSHDCYDCMSYLVPERWMHNWTQRQPLQLSLGQVICLVEMAVPGCIWQVATFPNTCFAGLVPIGNGKQPYCKPSDPFVAHINTSDENWRHIKVYCRSILWRNILKGTGSIHTPQNTANTMIWIQC